MFVKSICFKVQTVARLFTWRIVELRVHSYAIINTVEHTQQPCCDTQSWHSIRMLAPIASMLSTISAGVQLCPVACFRLANSIPSSLLKLEKFDCLSLAEQETERDTQPHQTAGRPFLVAPAMTHRNPTVPFWFSNQSIM
jgi:hypothetical protein